MHMHCSASVGSHLHRAAALTFVHAVPCCVLCCAVQGDEYFSKERARLERMISSGGVAANKVDDFARKSSVLSAFVAETAEE